MKTFWLRSLLFLPVPLILIGVTYFVDPANLFREDYDAGIVNYLLEGYNVTNLGNCNERNIQKLYIEKMKKCPDVVVLGSSRGMSIDKDMIPNNHLINNSMTAGSLEDFLAIWYLYKERGCENQIRQVWISIDPWLLNDHNEIDHWRELSREYTLCLDLLQGKTATDTLPAASSRNYSKYKELVSFSYFKSALEYLWVNKKIVHYEPTLSDENEGMSKHTDGSIYYDAKYRYSSPEEIESRAQNLVAYTRKHLLGFTTLNPEYCLIFEQFVEYLQSQGVEVNFFLCPFHPLVYSYFEDHFPVAIKVETYCLDFAQSHHIQAYGSFNPEKYQLENTDFLDGFHLREQVIARIIDQ
ncbi:MAG: hypothetical protein LBN18_04325 [Dysgonamonadaceae bacterium]|jgi:hypothetical protein|nr:hypothetical protein [Dysgonamonadaceae bacterium]